MAHLTEATIVGLAGRTDSLHIAFDRHLNIVYGLNGSGKTSLMKILHSAMSGNAGILENVPFKEATVCIYSLDYKKVFTRRIKKEALPVEKPDVAVEDEIVAQMELPEIVRRHMVRADKLAWTEEPRMKRKDMTSWRHRYLPTARLHVSDYPFMMASPAGLRGSLSEELLDRFFADSLERLWSSYTGEMLRKVRDSQERGLARILGAVLSASRSPKPATATIDLEKAYECVQQFMKRQGPTKALGTLGQFKKRYTGDPSLQQVVQDIFRIEEDIAMAMTPRRELQKIIQRLYTGKKHVSFTDKTITVEDAEGKHIGLASLSSGEKHLMRILVEALLAEMSTILIDEPELSMHVDWQSELVPTLKTLNPEAQFVLATHSPEVMACVPDNQVFAL